MISECRPLLSIAMSTFNGGKYLQQQLDSIVNQSYANIEIIIVDDVSADNTVGIIKMYQQNYSFVRFYQNEKNLGLVKSFEKAISLCKGEYIALADQDDIWFPNKLEQLITNIGDNLLIHSDAILIDENAVIISNSHFDKSKNRNKHKFIDYLISNNVTGCTAMFSKELVKLAFPIPGGFYAHDHYLAIMASFFGRIKLLNRPLIYYRQHKNNLIGATRPSFETFLNSCKLKAESYTCLLNLEIFKNNKDIELTRDYRLSLYLGKWTSSFNILKLLLLKHGVKLFIFYFFKRQIYNFLGKTSL